MVTTEIRVGLHELDRLSIKCGRCDAAVIFPAETDERAPSHITDVCPSCGGVLEHVFDLVCSFRNLHRMAGVSPGLTVELIVPVKTDGREKILPRRLRREAVHG